MLPDTRNIEVTDMRMRISGTDFMNRHFTRPSVSWKEITAIWLPLMAEVVFSNVFGLINSGMISSSGVTSLSAVSLVDSLNNFLLVFYTGVSTGASVVVAKHRGFGRKDRLHEACVQAVTSVTMFTLLTALVVILFNKPLLKMLFGAAEEEVMSKALTYMLGGAISLPLVGVTVSMCGVLRGTGEGKTALTYTIISTLYYVGFNVLFLAILKMGIPGLILSITLTRTLNVVLLLTLMKVRKSQFTFRFREFFHIDFNIFRSIMRIGMPCAAENLFFTGGRLVTQTIIVPMGTLAIATYNVSFAIMSVSQCLGSAVYTTMFTVTGICLGKARHQDIRDLTKSFTGLATVMHAIACAVVLALFPVLVQFYHAPQEIVADIFVCVLTITFSNILIHPSGFMLPSIFRAAGNGMYCTVMSLVIMWAVRVFAGYVLGVWFGMGVMGVWIAMILDWLARAIIYSLHYRKKSWLEEKETIF